MTRKPLVAALIAASVSFASMGLAQEVPAPEAHSPGGYRVDENASGFQLVTHGVWAAAATGRETAPLAVAPSKVPFQPSKSQSATTAPSGFRRATYLRHVYAAENRYSLPTGLLDALVWTESRYNPLAVSKAGAAGLGQLMPGTARDLGVANRFDPIANISGAARYLRQMFDKFGVVHLALAAYNAGPGAVERAGGIPLNGETPTYVRNVMRHWQF